MVELESDAMPSELPFGDPDAVRSDPRDLIEIEGVYQSPLRNASAMSERVIIGRKGSGKTHYLRAHQIAARARGFVTLESSELLHTTTLISIVTGAEPYLNRLRRLSSTFSPSTDSLTLRFWTMLWERAILLSVASMFYARRPLVRRPEIALSQEEFRAHFEAILRPPLDPLPPTSFLARIAQSVRGATGWEAYLEHSLWSELKTEVSRLLSEAPEISCYIDCIDEEFEQAPALWAECQHGLFFAVFQSFAERELFSKVHFVVALRDIVFAAVGRTEHVTRYATNSHIRHLTWDQVTTRRFLIEKINRLDPRHLAPGHGDSADPFVRWLGFSTLQNEKRQIVEPVADYILRHSRMLPRDVVVIGNAVHAEMARRKLQEKDFGPASLRNAVNASAEQFARESLEICINEALMSTDYMTAVLQDARNEGETSNDSGPSGALISGLREMARQNVYSLFDKLGREEQFTYDELQNALHSSKLIRSNIGGSLFSDVDRPAYRFDNILWRHGMIAVFDDRTRGGRWRYNWRATSDVLTLPDDGARYGFHASLLSLFKLKVGNEGPVY